MSDTKGEKFVPHFTVVVSSWAEQTVPNHGNNKTEMWFIWDSREPKICNLSILELLTYSLWQIALANTRSETRKTTINTEITGSNWQQDWCVCVEGGERGGAGN